MTSYWFRNGAVYTMNDSAPWADAVVVHDGVIVFVGGETDSRRHCRGDETEVDLDGGFLMPGFVDGHDHLIGGAMGKVGVSLEGAAGKDAVVDRIRQYCVDHPDDEVVRGHGWTQFTFGAGVQPHRSWLDDVTGARPALLNSYDIHDAWANTAAFIAAGIDATTPDPRLPTAYWPRDADGFPAGTCCEPESWIPIALSLGLLGLSAVKQAMDLTLAPAPSWGITSYFDASTMSASRQVENEIWDHVLELDRQGELGVRVVGSHVVRNPTANPDTVVEALRQRHESVRSRHVAITTLKLFHDGVEPQHTAAMLEPYADQGHHGGWVLVPAKVRELSVAANSAGFDVHVHACGDAAVRSALDTFEHIHRMHRHLKPRNTVCHVTTCNPSDVPRFAELGVTANCTPLWGTDYRGEFIDSYPALVGPERFRRDFCPYGSIARTGANVTFGADCPGVEVHEIAPLVQIEAAVTRRRPGRPDDRPAGAHEQISVAQALRCYTLNGARALRLDHLVGSIEVGKAADLVLLTQNPFEVAHHEIHTIPIRLTMMDGRLTHGTPE